MNKLYLLFGGLLIFFLFTTNCEEENNCDELINNLMVKVNFYTIDKGKEVAIAFDTLAVYGEEFPDSLLYGSKQISNLNLPLSKLSDTSSFVLSYGDISKDTIQFIYSRKYELASTTCGYRLQGTIISFSTTKNIMD